MYRLDYVLFKFLYSIGYISVEKLTITFFDSPPKIQDMDLKVEYQDKKLKRTFLVTFIYYYTNE